MTIRNLNSVAAIVFTVSLAFIAGCVGISKPADSTTAWVPPSRAQKPDAIWAGLREQKLDFSNSLTLAELSDIALRNNPASSKAWSDASVAAAQTEQAEGYFMPSITASSCGVVSLSR